MQPDFTRAKQWDNRDINYVDVDLSSANTKPLALGLAGKKIFVSLQAWDDEYTISSTKTVGSAIITLNEPQGRPLELASGLFYDLGQEFEEIYIRNTAQANKMMRIVTSVDADINPFSGEVQVVGGTSTIIDDLADLALSAAAAHAQVLPQLATRKTCLIKNIGAGTVRLGKQPTNTRGHLLDVGETFIADGTYELRGFSQAGATVTRTWLEE